MTAPGIVHEDAPHQAAGDTKEVRAVQLVNEPQVGLVYQRRGLQQVARLLAAQCVRGQPCSSLWTSGMSLSSAELIASTPKSFSSLVLRASAGVMGCPGKNRLRCQKGRRIEKVLRRYLFFAAAFNLRQRLAHY